MSDIYYDKKLFELQLRANMFSGDSVSYAEFLGTGFRIKDDGIGKTSTLNQLRKPYSYKYFFVPYENISKIEKSSTTIIIRLIKEKYPFMFGGHKIYLYHQDEETAEQIVKYIRKFIENPEKIKKEILDKQQEIELLKTNKNFFDEYDNKKDNIFTDPIHLREEEKRRQSIEKVLNLIYNRYCLKKQLYDKELAQKKNNALIEKAREENRISNEIVQIIDSLKENEDINNAVNNFININIISAGKDVQYFYNINANETMYHNFTIEDILRYFIGYFAQKDYLFEFSPDSRLDYIERYSKYYKLSSTNILNRLIKEFIEIIIEAEVLNLHNEYNKSCIEIALHFLIMRNYLNKIAEPFENNVRYEIKEYNSVIKEYDRQKWNGCNTSVDAAFSYVVKNNIYISKYDIFFHYSKFVEDVKKYREEKEKQEEKENYKRLLLGKEECTNYKIYTIDDIDMMNGIEFEQFLCLLFEKMGYMTIQTKGSGDQGIDVIAQNNICKIGIQAKRYTGNVGNAAVQEALAGKMFYNCDRVMVITNSTFTPMAVDLANKTHVELWDRDFLKRQIDICQVEKE